MKIPSTSMQKIEKFNFKHFENLIHKYFQFLFTNIYIENIFIIVLSSVLSFHFIFPSLNDVLNQPDSRSNMYLSWYVYDSFVTSRLFNLKEFYKTNQLYPFSFNLAQDEFALFPSITLYGPIYFLTENYILASKVLILLSFNLTFLFTYLPLKILIKNKGLAIIGSFIFTFSPSAIYRFLSGHLEYLYRFFIPITFISFIYFLKKPNLKNSIIFFIFFGLNLMTNLQLSLYLSVLLIFYLIIFCIFEINGLKSAISHLVKIMKYSLLGILLLAPIIYFYIPYAYFLKLESYRTPLRDISENSAQIRDFFMGIPQNIFFGKFYSQLYSFRNPRELNTGFNIAEHSYFIGFIPTILIFIFIITLNKNANKNKLFVNIFIIALIGILISLGPYFLNENIKLPYYYFYKFIPFLGFSRTPGRINIIVIFLLTILAIVALGNIEKRFNLKHWKIIEIVIFILIFLEYQNIPLINPLNKELRINYELSGKKVLFLPFESGINNVFTANYLNFIPQNKFTMVNGATGIVTEGYRRLIWQIESGLGNEKWQYIVSGLKLDYLILDKYLLSVTENNINWFQFIAKNKKQIVYSDNHWIIFDTKNNISNECYSDTYEGLILKMVSTKINKKKSRFDIEVSINNASNCHKRLFYDKNYLPLKYYLDFGNKINKVLNPIRQGKIYLKSSPIILKGEEETYYFSFPIQFLKIIGIKNIQIFPEFNLS